MNGDIKDYLTHFQKEFSKELKNYITNEVFLNSRYIFVYRRKKQQYGYCTHCNQEFKTDNLKHNQKTKCPECTSICTIKHSGRGRKHMQDSAYFVYYEKSAIDKKTIVARGIYAERDYSEDYKEVKTEYRIKTHYIFDTENKKGGIMFGEPNWWGVWANNKDYNGYQQCRSVHSYFHNYSRHNTLYIGVSKDSIKEAVKDTPFSWSGWEEYLKSINTIYATNNNGEIIKYYENNDDMVKFFDLYSKYPCVEYLIKLDFTKLVIQKLIGERTYRTINWRGKDLFSVLKINKQQLQEIRQKNIHVSYMFLRLIQKSKKLGWGFTLEETKEIESLIPYIVNELEEKIFTIATPKKAFNYIKKQRAKFPEHFQYTNSTITTYRDYLKDCKKLEMDLTKDTVLFPRNLHTAHQNTIKQVKYKEDQELDKKIRKRFKDLIDRYYFTTERLIIRPAKDTKELIEEGKALNHCVGGYAGKYAKGDNILLFIRKVEEVDKPYYTVEVRNNEIVQVRGKDNCNPTEDITGFIEEFIKAKLTKRGSKKNVGNKDKLSMPA